MSAPRDSRGHYTSAPRPGTRVQVTTGSRAGSLGVIANGPATRRGFVKVIITDTPDGVPLPMEARGFGQYRADTLVTIA